MSLVDLYDSGLLSLFQAKTAVFCFRYQDFITHTPSDSASRLFLLPP